ncbi:GGDEF domain-containing protein [Thiorhodospira sibirica]|uniref:GGDEF domain-containing protein n=1 Tax=Thiorhodospira sibirica TaxID=154347 RepID=UPI00022C52CD|nr:diguanylate cyclase [Thiorhodospira sibirica]
MTDKTIEQQLWETTAEYFDTHFLQRDHVRACSFLSPSVQGVGTGLDEFACKEDDFRRIYARDFEQAPNPIEYQIRASHIAVISASVGIVTCALSLRTTIADQALTLNHLRISLVFAKHGTRWLIEYVHLSFPSTAHGADESYPIKELEARNQVLQRLVEQRTQELQTAMQKITYLATTDKLTGIANRSKIDEVLEHELHRAARYQSRFALILFDIDHFKRVNDGFGHLTGDRVLQEFTNLVAQRIRQSDIFGRWGGEEFILLCQDTDADNARRLAEDLRQKIANHRFGEIKHATASFGVTLYIPDDTADAIIARADRALYQSKQSGRNRVTLL